MNSSFEIDPIVKKVQTLDLLLADELKRICEMNQIQFFMIAGTLLGAVRHHGFIPWDDDMDFGMRREDYERFLIVAETQLDSEKFTLLTNENLQSYPHGFAKLVLRNTVVDNSLTKNYNIRTGISIDIFPFDAVPNQRILKILMYNRYKFYKMILMEKCKDLSHKGDYDKKPVLFLLSKMFSVQYLKEQKKKAITAFNGKQTKEVITGDGSYGMKKETLLSAYVDNIAYYTFEDRVYPGIADSDGYLSYFYGDYMQLPPVNKRNKHERVSVDFGIYATEEVT